MADENQVHILKIDLRNGVNLLVGAGFSRLANAGPKIKELPVGNELRNELVDVLQIVGGQASLPLPKLYSVIMNGPKKDQAMMIFIKY